MVLCVLPGFFNPIGYFEILAMFIFLYFSGDVSWEELETKGHISTVVMVEVCREKI
jgi:hypothetical protein